MIKIKIYTKKLMIEKSIFAATKNMWPSKNTKNYYDQCISIPLYYDLKLKEQIYIINAIKELIN